MPRYTFSKNERLSSLKEIDHLFKEGKSIASFPIRLIWIESDPQIIDTPVLRVMFSAPKKKFPRAVDRNRVKRLMRECYRLEKNQVFEKIGPHKLFSMALVFTGSEIPDHAAIQKSLSNALERWINKITPVTPNT